MGTFPFEILGDSGLEKNFDEFSTIHDVLGNKIDVPVPVVTELFVGLLLISEKFPKVGEVD